MTGDVADGSDRRPEAAQAEEGRPSLDVGRYVIRFRFLQDAVLPAPAASLWRGVLGRQLRRMSEAESDAALPLPGWLRQEELYRYFMETPPPPDTPVMRRYNHVPHPYVISTPWQLADLHVAKGGLAEVRLNLFGRANDLLALLIIALARAGADGLGRRRAQARLVEVREVAPDSQGDAEAVLFAPGRPLAPRRHGRPQVPDSVPAQVRIDFLSPLRLSREGRIVRDARQVPAALAMNLVRRLAMLQLFHEGRELQADFRHLKELAENGLRLAAAQLGWQDAHRYSGRQKRKTPLGGLMGHIVLDLSEAKALWPYIWLGQFVHAGKGTVFGLGAMQVTTL